MRGNKVRRNIRIPNRRDTVLADVNHWVSTDKFQFFTEGDHAKKNIQQLTAQEHTSTPIRITASSERSVMSKASRDQPKMVFTPEQRHALSRVYGFLMEIGRQRLNRLKATGAIDPASTTLKEDSIPDQSTAIPISPE